MAKSKSLPAVAIVTVAADVAGCAQPIEVRFGKGDKVQKLAFPVGAEVPTGVLYVPLTGAPFVQDYSRYPESVKNILLFHGAKQKGGDEYADLDDVADCIEAVREIDARLAEGKWKAEREGFAGTSVLLRAIMKVYGIGEPEAREFLKPLSAKDKMGLRASEELRAAVQEIEAERGKGADVSKLIERLKAPVAPAVQPAV